MGLKNHSGLANLLSGETSIQQVIQATSFNGLFVLTRGACPPNPSELLGSNTMRGLVANLREKFDFILIDSPPVIAVTDAVILSTMCDGVLLVLHSKQSTTAAARQALDRLGSVRARVLGTILNSIDLGDPDYNYYRHYYEYRADYSRQENNGDSAASFDGLASSGLQPESVQAVSRSLHDDTQGNGKQEPEDRHFEQDPALLRSPAPVNGDGIVPAGFVEHMILNLTDAIGPMAPLVVRDQIKILGEPLDAFPKRRLVELIDNVCDEILDENLRQRFKKSMGDPRR
jgi:hypothetical protein